ncbi:MAG: glycine cleavage system H protein [Saprospiraceae bacterium]|jgi:glycine cleavage system H protein|tara:strand:- start:1696 stop:2136 length:441 start_codon:yes stop_codon:yes gene_type:complete
MFWIKLLEIRARNEGFLMNAAPSNLKYATSHEWVRDEGDGTVTVGISNHAQESLGDVVYVELPEPGKTLCAGEEAGVVESVKAASDIYVPISGEVIAINELLEGEPEVINGSPYDNGWFFKVKMSDPTELNNLMNADEYESLSVDS